MQTPAQPSDYRPHPRTLALDPVRSRNWAEFDREQEQERLAKTGNAVNQCPHCGAYRLDRYPPVFHVPGIPHSN